MMRLKSAKFLFFSCTLFFIFCQFIESGLAVGHQPSPETDKAKVTEAEASGDDNKQTVKEGKVKNEEEGDKKPMEDEKDKGKEKEEEKGNGNGKGKGKGKDEEKEEKEEKGEEKGEGGEGEGEGNEELKAKKKSLNEIIEEDTKAIEGQKKGGIKTVEDTIVTLNLKCPNPSSDEMREKWEKMTDPEIRKERKWISQCGFLLNIKDAVEDWLLLLRRQGKIEKDFELMTVRPILKSKKEAPPGWRYGPDEEEVEKKWEKELDFAVVVQIYMAMDKKEDREALTDALPADLIWENQFPYTFVKKKLMELNKYKKHGIEAQAKEIEKQLTSILETEQDVIAGNKLIFENEEHIEAMKEHLDNRDAQISQKLRHLWPDKVRKSLNDHAKKGKAGNVKKLLTGKTGHAKRSRTI